MHTGTCANADALRRPHTDADISQHSGECEHTQTHTDERTHMQTRTHSHADTNERHEMGRRANYIQCVGRHNCKMRPDTRCLFKDFRNVLYVAFASCTRIYM